MSKDIHTEQEKLNKLIIFDFDGTLADTSQTFIEAFDRAAPAVGGVAYKREETAQWKELDALEMLRQHGVEQKCVARFAELMRVEMSFRISRVQLFPNVLSVLAELVSDGHTLGLVTSNSEEMVTAVLGEEFDNLFAASCFNTPIGGKEEKLKKMAAESKPACSAVFYVGDELRDLRAAEAAGVHFVGVSWGFNSAQSLRRAGCRTVISDLSELPGALLQQDSEDLTQHLNALYGYAMILSRDSSKAADLVQETYLRAVAAKNRLWKNSAVKSWLFTILRNVWLNQLRKDKNEQAFEADREKNVEQRVAALPESRLDPELAYEQKVAQQMVRAALAELPSEFREVILLREFEDLPYQEIAEILGCPAGTVMSRLARGRAKLRDLLTAGQPDQALPKPVRTASNRSVCT